MKIFMLSRGYPTEKYKMNGIFEMDQAKALVKAGHDVVFLSVDLRSIRRSRDFGIDYFIQDGVKVYSIDLPLGNIPKVIFYKIGIWACKKIYKLAVTREGRPDIMHTYFTDQGYMMTKAFKGQSFPLVLTECNSHINKDHIEPGLKKAASYAYDHVDRLITVSPDFRRHVKKVFNKDSDVVTVIPNLDIFNYVRKEPRPGFCFVSTGRITKAKGMEDLVEAFIAGFKEDRDVSIDIFGDGDIRQDLIKRVEDAGMEDRIKLWGMTDRKLIAKAYQEADCFCLYSHSETFGLAYLEALASGLPIISSRCGGPEHLIREDNGLLIDLNDRKALGEAMLYMRNNIEKYDREAISNWAHREYSDKAITEDIVKIYKELVNA